METNRLWVSFSLGLPHLNKTHFVSVEESSQVGSVNQASIFKSKKKKRYKCAHFTTKQVFNLCTERILAYINIYILYYIFFN